MFRFLKKLKPKTKRQLWKEACLESERYYLALAERHEDSKNLKKVTKINMARTIRQGPPELR